MSKRSYNWLTNIALVLGVLSAFLYGQLGVLHVFAVVSAVVAGLLAVGAYFYNQFSSSKSPKAKTAMTSQKACDPAHLDMVAVDGRRKEAVIAETKTYQRQAEMIEAIQIAEDQAAMQKRLDEQIRVLTSLLESQRKASAARTAAYMQQYLLKNNAARRLRYRFAGEKSLMVPEVELSANEAAACYAQIMREMASDDRKWDFVVDAHGLRVSEKKHQVQVFEVDIELFLQDQENPEDSGFHPGLLRIEGTDGVITG